MSTLWLDTSTVDTSLALLEDGKILSLHVDQANALDFIFESLDTALEEAGQEFADLEKIYYCCGPGSSLGLRIASMALRTWKVTHPKIELFAAYTLPVYAALHAYRPEAPEAFTLLAQHRKDTWYKVRYADNAVSEMSELSDGEVSDLEAAPLYHVRQRKFATQPPSHSQPMEPNLAALPNVLLQSELFQLTPEPILFPATAPTFRKWTPERHRKA